MLIDEFLFQSDEQLAKLQHLNLNGKESRKLNANEWSKFCNSLYKCAKKLQSLSIDEILLGNATLIQWKLFCSVISLCTRLTEISLHSVCLQRLTTDHWLEFGNSLEDIKLRKLLIGSNIGNSPLHVWIGFCIIIATNTSLESLSLWNGDINALDKSRWELFGAAISQNPTLRTIKMRYNHLYELTEEQILAMGEALAKCKNLLFIDFSNNNLYTLTDAQWLAWREALTKVKKLEFINFDANCLHELSPKQFNLWCDALSTCKNLRTVSCIDVGIKSDMNPNKFFRYMSSSSHMPLIVKIRDRVSIRLLKVLPSDVNLYSNRKIILAWCASIANLFIQYNLPKDQNGVRDSILDFVSPPSIDRKLIEQFFEPNNDLLLVNYKEYKANPSRYNGHDVIRFKPLLWQSSRKNVLEIWSEKIQSTVLASHEQNCIAM